MVGGRACEPAFKGKLIITSFSDQTEKAHVPRKLDQYLMPLTLSFIILLPETKHRNKIIKTHACTQTHTHPWFVLQVSVGQPHSNSLQTDLRMYMHIHILIKLFKSNTAKEITCSSP